MSYSSTHEWESDLNAALGEILRMRLAAERIMRLAESDRRYGKGRGQAAQEILDAASEQTPRFGKEDNDVLEDLRERQKARIAEQARLEWWRDFDELVQKLGEGVAEPIRRGRAQR